MVEHIERADLGRAALLEHVHAGDGGVHQARAQALVELVGREVRRDDRGQAHVEAVVDDLEQLLLRPRRRRLRAQIVEDEDGRVADALEQLVVAHLGAGAVGGAQVVEEVGHDHEKRRLAAFDDAVHSCGGDVRFAAAAGAGEQHPAVGRLGEGARVGDATAVHLLRARIGAAAALDEVREGQAR